MDVARCTADGITYTIQLFESRGESFISEFRRLLVCPECSGPAFYRRESTSGQGACFGARPHHLQCTLGAAEAKRGGTIGPNEHEIIHQSEKIVVDFAFGAHEFVHPDPPVTPDEPFGHGGRFIQEGGRRTSHMHRRLSTLLKNLIYSEVFRRSEQLIALPEGEYRVKDFFVNFSSVANISIGSYCGFWGMISDAGLFPKDKPSLWLNSGGREAVSVVIDVALGEGFQKRYPIFELEKFSGSYVLVFGELRLSKNNKPYISVKDINKITLSFD